MGILKKYTAADIKAELAKRHHDDFFLTEVKTGSTWMDRNLGILDAWAMKKSWVTHLYTGYEVKVTRSDFLRDDKYLKYLPMCNRFYFATPPDLIDKKELPDFIGLLEIRPQGGFVTVRKAVHRNIEIPSNLFKYILMSRIESDRYPFFSDRKEHFIAWLENKKTNVETGRLIHNKIFRELQRLSIKNNELNSELSSFNSCKEILKSAGISGYNIQYEIQKLVSSSPVTFDENDIYELKRIKSKLDSIIEKIDNKQNPFNG